MKIGSEEVGSKGNADSTGANDGNKSTDNLVVVNDNTNDNTDGDEKKSGDVGEAAPVAAAPVAEEDQEMAEAGAPPAAPPAVEAPVEAPPAAPEQPPLPQ